MPFTDSGLWIPRQIRTKNAERSERRPHWLTVVLGLASTLLTTGAVIVGIVTLRETNRNFKISNQAFVIVRNLKHTFDGPDRLDTTFDLENTGLTLATEVEVRIAHMPDVSYYLWKKSDSRPLSPPPPLDFNPELMVKHTGVSPHQIIPGSYFYDRSMVGAKQAFYLNVRYTTIFGQQGSVGTCYYVDFDRHVVNNQCPLDKMADYTNRALSLDK